MQNARCALVDTSAVGLLVRRPPTNRSGDTLTGRRLLVRPGARFDSAEPVLSNKEVHTPSCEGLIHIQLFDLLEVLSENLKPCEIRTLCTH